MHVLVQIVMCFVFVSAQSVLCLCKAFIECVCVCVCVRESVCVFVQSVMCCAECL
jgi:hypothetical protein